MIMFMKQRQRAATLPPLDRQGLEEQIASRLRTFTEGVSLEGSETFPDEVNRRLAGVSETASLAVSKVPPEKRQDVMRLLSVALTSASTAKKIHWLHRAADVLGAAFGPNSACRAGCSHCCHIPVSLSATEARAIGKAIGHPPAAVSEHIDVAIEGYEAPCPFLRDDQCSIHPHRPAVCRTHLNLDVDDLLCRLIPGRAIPVPYVDTRLFAIAGVEIEPNASNWADIRQWFPTQRDT